MSDSDTPEKPKLIIDEDWKTKVQAEKEAAKKKSEESPAESNKPADESSSAHGPLPPASLMVLISSLATQTLFCLGQIPMPGAEQPTLDLEQAKHLIDLLEVLQEKTNGNRTSEESAALDNVLHELHMAFIRIKGRPQQ